MIIDAHQHVFWHGRDDAGLVADMDEHGIDLAWLLSWEVPPSEDAKQYHAVLNPEHLRADGTHPGVPLSDAIRTRDRYPERFILGYCPDPRASDAPGLFESAYRMHRVRVCGEWKYRMPLDDPRCLELFRKAGELGCPVVFHIDVPYLKGQDAKPVYQPQWYGGTVDNLDRALQACPRTIFIGHAPGFWRHISGDTDDDPATYPQGSVTEGGRVQRLLETYPNLYADLSAGSGLGALKRDADHAKRFLAKFADRLLFARDYYGGELHEFLQTLDLPADVRDRIYTRNAQALLAGSTTEQ